MILFRSDDNDDNDYDSEVFEEGQADVMIGENYAPSGQNKSIVTNRQEQSLVV